MRKRIVPIDNDYKTVAFLNNTADNLLYSSTVVSIGVSALSYFKLMHDLQTALIVINSLVISVFLFLDSRANYVYTKAEMIRRLDWMDNSFDTNFSGKKSQNYFTNAHLNPGLYKLAVNGFENSHHTHFIISKMLTGIITKTIIIVLVFIVSAYFGNGEIVRLFFELTLPALLIQKLIKAVIYSSRISNVHDRFKLLFNDLMKHSFDNKAPEAIRDLIDYETTVSWASLPLNSDIFWKHRDQLAKDWAQLKKEYKIS